MDRQPIPVEIQTQIDNLLRAHGGSAISSNFEKNKSQLIELRSALQKKNYQETKFQDWFGILDGGNAASCLELFSESGNLSPYAMAEIPAIITIISGGGADPELSAGSPLGHTFHDEILGPCDVVNSTHSIGDEELMAQTTRMEKDTGTSNIVPQSSAANNTRSNMVPESSAANSTRSTGDDGLRLRRTGNEQDTGDSNIIPESTVLRPRRERNAQDTATPANSSGPRPRRRRNAQVTANSTARQHYNLRRPKEVDYTGASASRSERRPRKAKKQTEVIAENSATERRPRRATKQSEVIAENSAVPPNTTEPDNHLYPTVEHGNDWDQICHNQHNDGGAGNQGSPSFSQNLNVEDAGNYDQFFTEWQNHGLKFKEDLTRESLRFDSVGKWLPDNVYCCILYNHVDFDLLDGSEWRMEVGVATSRMEDYMAIMAKESWDTIDAFEVGRVSMTYVELQFVDDLKRKYIRRVYKLDEKNDRVLTHTRCVLSEFSVFAQDLTTELVAIKDRFGAAFEKMVDLSSILTKQQ